MEKKSVVTTPRGYTIKVADHMLGDLAKFGATKSRPTLKPVPKELINAPAQPKPLENLPEMKEVKAEVVPPAEPKVRKTPVRSKSKK